jgi:site-specific recombinase XerD
MFLANCLQIVYKQLDQMSISIRLMQRSDFTRKNREKAIYLRVTANRKIHYLHLGIHTDPRFFKKGQISKADSESDEKNEVIEYALNRAQAIKFEALKLHRQLSLTDFLTKYHSKEDDHPESFYDFFEKEMLTWKATLADETIRTYKSEVSKLKIFRSNLQFKEIDQQMIKDYIAYMIEKLSNTKSTYNKSLRILKRILTRAQNAGVKVNDPFTHIKLENVSGTRMFLTSKELSDLHNLYQENNSDKITSHERNVLRYFLFCCFTGLRYRDIRDLRAKNIESLKDKDGTETKIIVITMHKTKDLVRIPVVPQAEALLPNLQLPEQKLFKVLTGQATNRSLAAIMEAVKINKKITIHCSRHTFATVGRSNGIPLDVMALLLGHKSIKATQIYTKYDDQMKIQEMKKFETI